MKELQNRYAMFVDILQEKYHDAIDEVQKRQGNNTRYEFIIMIIFNLLEIFHWFIIYDV